jgi:uncharacterized OB-fold protein
MKIPCHWRLKAQRYRLEGSTCPNCGQPIFPPRPVCPYCNAKSEGSAKRIMQVLMPLTTFTEVETHIGYRITERLIA